MSVASSTRNPTHNLYTHKAIHTPIYTATTRDKRVFSFYDNGIPCEGARGVLSRYRELAPHVRLAGPTSFAPIIREVRWVWSCGGFV